MRGKPLTETHPEVAKYWHPTLNGSLTPAEVSIGTKQSYWWLGECGHSSFQLPSNRGAGKGCSVCAGRQVLAGFNDLASKNPALAAEWHPSKNAPLTPENVTPNSNKNYWWFGSCGHEWEAKASNRNQTGAGCPICLGKRVLVGFNDLTTTQPELAKQWHPAKNGQNSADHFSAGSNKKAWWIDEHGHEWESVISNRAKGAGCPYCAFQLVLSGFNDLATTNPELAKQWHPTLNGDLKANQVIAGSNKFAYWQCENRHEWQSQISSRNTGIGCPVCSNQLLVSGINDMATSHPEIAKELHPTLNGTITSADVFGGYNKKLWWICPKGHEYEMTANSRTQGGGCSVCAQKIIIPGVNDLATLRPEIAITWHPSKNLPVTPSMVSPGTSKKFWWQCELGHEWVTSCNSRAGKGCPTCSNRVLLKGFNDLATTNPKLASQWHPTLNGELRPDDIVLGSVKKVWWQCPLDNRHVWQVSPNGRSRDQSCPVCANRIVISGVNDMATTHPRLASEFHPTKNMPLTPKSISAGTRRKIWWICSQQPEHVWLAYSDSRVQGRDCPSCAQTGFDPNLPGIFYFLEHPEYLARKVGITNQGLKTDRVANFKADGWNVINLWTLDKGHSIRTLETYMLRWIRKDLGLPQYLGAKEMKRTGGASETFSGEGPTNEEIILRIEAELANLTSPQS